MIFEEFKTQFKVFAEDMGLKVYLWHALELVLPKGFVKFNFDWFKTLNIIKFNVTKFLSNIMILSTF